MILLHLIKIKKHIVLIFKMNSLMQYQDHNNNIRKNKLMIIQKKLKNDYNI